MAFHRGKRTANDVSTDSHDKELSVRSNQRGNSPQRDDREHKQNATRKFEPRRELPIEQKEFRRCDSRKRSPPDWSFGQKSERKRDIEHPPPMRRLMFDV